MANFVLLTVPKYLKGTFFSFRYGTVKIIPILLKKFLKLLIKFSFKTQFKIGLGFIDMEKYMENPTSGSLG